MEDLWNANSAEVLKVRAAAKDDPDDDSEFMVLGEPAEPVTNAEEVKNGRWEEMSMAFTVDFSRFTDKEITTAFQKWLTQNRPLHWRKPKRVIPGAFSKGHKRSDYRAALDRLALMRLLHWQFPEQLKRNLPEAWARYQHKQESFRREIQEGVKFFRKQFPFLPPDEVPSSAKRMGVWLPEAVKVAEEVEREMGL